MARFAPGSIANSADSLDEGAFNAGRGFQRLWLRATLERLAMQPMAASTVLALQSQDDPWASRAASKALADGWAGVLPAGQVPMMLFRMGQMNSSPAPSVKVGRRPLEAYLA